MAYYGPPPPLTFEQWVAAGERDPGFEAWKKSVARDNTAAFIALGICGVLLLALAVFVAWRF